MWTNENRAKYNRDHLRYPSDLTDDEWALVEPFIPPPKPGGGKRKQDMRAVMNGVMYILSTGCQWRYLPKDFPPRSTVHNYSFGGTATACSIAFITRSTSNAASRRNEKEAPPLASSIVKASRAPKKGGPHRSARLRCRQADQGQEAAYSRRYAGSVAARHRSFRRHPGSRWRHRVAGNVVRSVSIPCEAVCRQRLSRADLRQRARQNPALPRNRNRQTTRSGKRLRAVAQALDRRTHDRLAQPLPPPRQGLGKSQPQRPRVLETRIHPPNAAKALQSMTKSWDGL